MNHADLFAERLKNRLNRAGEHKHAHIVFDENLREAIRVQCDPVLFREFAPLPLNMKRKGKPRGGGLRGGVD